MAEHGLEVAGQASGDLVPVWIVFSPRARIASGDACGFFRQDHGLGSAPRLCQRVEAPLLPVVEVIDLFVAEVRREPGTFPRVLDAVVVRSQKQQVRQELQGGNAARDVVAEAGRDQAAPIDDPQPADPADVADLANQYGRVRLVALAEPSSPCLPALAAVPSVRPGVRSAGTCFAAPAG